MKPDDPGAGARPVLNVRNLVKKYGGLTAVACADLRIDPGEIHALVGESGSGKTTLARCVLGLIPPTAGEISVDGRPLAGLSRAQLRGLRRRVQIVFQNPYAALNPRMTVRRLVTEPLRVAGRGEDEPAAVLEHVGLPADLLGRYPHELSGGQCQRVAIARALAARPALLVLDEPTSALDVSVQAQILNLLLDLRAETGLAYLFISHDLGVVRHLADRVSVMYRGEIVETGAARDVLDTPQHPYTRRLLDSVPRPGPSACAPSVLDRPQGARS